MNLVSLKSSISTIYNFLVKKKIFQYELNLFKIFKNVNVKSLVLYVKNKLKIPIFYN